MDRRKKRRGSRSRRKSSITQRVKGAMQSIVVRMKADVLARRPIFRFVLGFGLLMTLFYAFTTLVPFYKKEFFPAYLDFNAALSGSLLKAFGQQVTVAGQVIASSSFSLSIKQGCDAIEPSALLAAVILAFPAPFLRKIPGLIAGVFFLLALNLVRIITLFFINAHYPAWFHTAHVELWPMLFILLALVCWALWIQWAMQNQGGKVYVTD